MCGRLFLNEAQLVHTTHSMLFISHMAYTFASKLAKNGTIPVEGGVILFLLSILAFTGLPRDNALAVIFS